MVVTHYETAWFISGHLAWFGLALAASARGRGACWPDPKPSPEVPATGSKRGITDANPAQTGGSANEKPSAFEACSAQRPQYAGPGSRRRRKAVLSAKGRAMSAVDGVVLG